MNIQNIYELLERFEQSTVAELDLELEGATLKLKKAFGNKQMYLDVPLGTVPNGTPTNDINGTESVSVPIGTVPNGSILKAPLAGTFYRAASPEAEPFVVKGQKIKKGDVIGIIEAMKLMNEVVAEEDGTVEEILVEDGTLVAYDEGLIRYV